ncbi:hypothetical protein EZI54_07390 [Marinobacter halodurans]|uniref:ERCC4 domain-containing protein n=1 Tax=Marinobacter halodurans TaxID=2528979 RepID=A0ABY1ZME1_9GAMM|nr:helix-hairpin-helix domain-containing protein [Marinobacter halodurans]TBW57475.1 hypothetical protein EZI54_07390 [Marinobacter halodurans]
MVDINSWRHPETGRLRLYLGRSLKEEIIGQAGLDLDSLALSVWLQESNKGPHQWSLLAFRKQGALAGSVYASLKREVLKCLGVEASWDWESVCRQLDQAEPGDDTAPRPAAGRKPPRIDDPIRVTIGPALHNDIGKALSSHERVEVRENPELKVDLSYFNSRGDELVIRRLLAVQDGNADDLIEGQGLLFEATEALNFQAANTDHRVMAVVLIQCNVYDMLSSQMTRRQIDGAISFVTAVDQVSVFPCESDERAVELIWQLLGHFQRSAIVRSETRPVITLLDEKCALLQTIPGISRSLAEAILYRFGTIQALANALPSEIETVDGIGRRRARAIARVLQHGLAL